ncbi:hypothetical protein M3Y97_00731800 [Aphelenchoides bicaudatus]|nr:hypothetical protein M3Y97_00731800 [Aphelenchoides bicaudatus]
MEVFFFKPDLFDRYYNCSSYDDTTIPMTLRKHEYIGIGILGSYLFYMPLYCLIIYAMLKTQYRKRPSYRLMILLGCIHLLGLQASGICTAIYALQGDLFCSNPTMIYWSGSCWVGDMVWINNDFFDFGS